MQGLGGSEHGLTPEDRQTARDTGNDNKGKPTSDPPHEHVSSTAAKASMNSTTPLAFLTRYPSPCNLAARNRLTFLPAGAAAAAIASASSPTSPLK